MSSNPKTEKIVVEFNGKKWEFDYAPDLDEKHFKKILATEAPEIVNANAKISYADSGKTKVIKFEKTIGYKG